MYKFISTNGAERTRFIVMENTTTGTVEEYFDDSDIFSDTNFRFMEIGKEYDCKIMLFGDVGKGKYGENATCVLVNKNVLVGIKVLAEIKKGEDIYYVFRREVEHLSDQDSFEYNFTRKNLVQVDEVIHSNFLVDFLAGQ